MEAPEVGLRHDTDPFALGQEGEELHLRRRRKHSLSPMRSGRSAMPPYLRGYAAALVRLSVGARSDLLLKLCEQVLHEKVPEEEEEEESGELRPHNAPLRRT